MEDPRSRSALGLNHGFKIRQEKRVRYHHQFMHYEPLIAYARNSLLNPIDPELWTIAFLETPFHLTFAIPNSRRIVLNQIP